MEKLQNTETVLLAQVFTKPPPQMTTGQRRATYKLISFKEIPFSLEGFAPKYNVCQCKSKWTAKGSNNSTNVGIFQSKKLDRYSDGQFRCQLGWASLQ